MSDKTMLGGGMNSAMLRQETKAKELKKVADRLHTQILDDVKRVGHDPFEKFVFNQPDPMIDTAKSFLDDTVKSRKAMRGPSAVKERFSSKYWRAWNQEKNLLQLLSFEELQKERSMMSSTSTTLPAQADTDASTLSRKKKPKSKFSAEKKTVLKHARATTFAPAPTATARYPYFDHHLLGDTSVTHLVTRSLQQLVPAHSGDRDSMYDPLAIGQQPGRGGAMGRADQRPADAAVCITKTCDFPPMASLLSPSKGSQFSAAARFHSEVAVPTRPASAADTAGGTGLLGMTGDSVVRASAGFSFPKEERFKGLSKPAAAETTEGEPDALMDDGKDGDPGPGHYKLDRLFDEKPGLGQQTFEEIYQNFKVKPGGLIKLAAPQLANVAVFCHQCNRQEHTLYGVCLDSKCGYRAAYEDSAIRGNDLKRLSGYQVVDRLGKNKERLLQQIELGHTMAAFVPDPKYPMTALYAAAYRPDVDAIQRMAELGTNPNEANSQSGYTALHVAVFRCNIDAVQMLLDSFRGTINIEAQDHLGDTPLHLASRLGFVEIVSLICEESFDPNRTVNRKGLRAVDVVRSHRVYQEIQMAGERWNLTMELNRLKSSRSSKNTG